MACRRLLATGVNKRNRTAVNMDKPNMPAPFNTLFLESKNLVNRINEASLIKEMKVLNNTRN